MNAIFQIAWREYRQYVFTRGFLIFLLLFPVGIVLGSLAAGVSSATASLRAFVVIDQTGIYTDEIDAAFERAHDARNLSAWDAYITLAARPEALADHKIPAPFAPVEDADDASRRAAFAAAGGIEAAKAAAAPYLREGASAFTPPKRRFVRVAPPPDVDPNGSLSDVASALRPYLNKEKPLPEGAGVKDLFAAVLIPADFAPASENGAPAQFWSRNLTDPALRARIRRGIADAMKAQALGKLGVTPEEIAAVREIAAPVKSFRPDRAVDEAEISAADKVETALPAFLTYLLFLMVFSVANILLTNTIEEKSNKIVEVLLSSVTATELMIGKLLGVALVGLTMPAIFVGGGLAAVWFGLGEHEMARNLIESLLSTNLLPVFVFYFLIGYLTFASIYLAVGAMSNSIQDAQSYLGVITLITMAPLPFLAMIFKEPNGLLASIFTWIPLYTPYAVMLRVNADPPMWEIVGATALLMAFSTFMLVIMGRVFRRSLLNTGAPPKIRDLWKLMRS